MDILNYFDAVDPKIFAACGSKPDKFSLGWAIRQTTENITDSNFHNLNIVIAGAPFYNGKFDKDQKFLTDKIRSYLYNLALPSGRSVIADLGNLKPSATKRGSYLALRDIVEVCREMDVVTIVIGGSQDLTAGICEAYSSDNLFTLSVADSIFDVKRDNEQSSFENFLTGIFKKLTGLFQFNLIGFQNHLTGENLINKYAVSGEYLRLGQLRDNFLSVEPLLRNSDVLSLDMGVVSYGFAPATYQKNPNGLRGEEICLLSQFAGLSSRLKVFGLFGINYNDDINDQTFKLAAEIIWYFIEGFGNRRPFGKRLVYKVEITGLEQPVVFLREPDTERWWFEISLMTGEKMEIACSEKDYMIAKKNEIPCRWIKFIQKMDNLSK